MIMTAGEVFPEPDDFNNYEARLSGVSIDHEYLNRAGLASQLHLLYEECQELDEYHDDSRVRLGGLAMPMAERRFIRRTQDERVIDDMLYDEMLWRPKLGTVTAEQVDLIVVRHPILDGSPYTLISDEEGPSVKINDILVEIVLKSGEKQRYLLNDKTLSAYPDASMLDFDDSELYNPKRPNNQYPNVLTAHGDFWYFPPLTAVELRRMTIEDSEITYMPLAA